MKQEERVYGQRIEPPRLTGWGRLLLLWYVGLPVLLALLLLDIALWAFFALVLDSCYGLLCLI